MSLKEIEHSISSKGVERIYYEDEEGRLVERILHDDKQHDAIFEENTELAMNQKFGSNFRKVAEIPEDIVLMWLMEAGVDDYQLSLIHI